MRRYHHADCLRDRNNAAGIGDNFPEIGDEAAGMVDIATNVIPCQTPSWMETGVTLFKIAGLYGKNCAHGTHFALSA